MLCEEASLMEFEDLVFLKIQLWWMAANESKSCFEVDFLVEKK